MVLGASHRARTGVPARTDAFPGKEEGDEWDV